MSRRPQQQLTFAPDDSAADTTGSVWIEQDVPMAVACRFPHEDKASRYELGLVPGKRLKRQLVECVLTMSEPDRGVGSSSSVERYVMAIRSFLRFLGDDAATGGVADLDDVVVDRFQDSMVARYGSDSGRPRTLVNAVCLLLREAIEEHGVTLRPSLQRRILFGATCSTPPPVPRDAYTPGEARSIARAARLDVGRVIRRIMIEGPALVATGGHPDRTEGGWRSKANLAWYFHTYGDRTVDQLREESGGDYVVGDPKEVSVLAVRPLLWPTVHDLVGFWILLLLQTELTSASAALLTTGCLANPSAGRVTIRHHKHRAGRSRSERVARVQDGNGTSPGGIIRNLLRVTAGARRWVDSDELWVAITEKAGCTTRATRSFRIRNGWISPLEAFALDHDLVWEAPPADGSERLVLHGSRLRKTYVAAAYRAVGGDIGATAQAAGNTARVAMRHYADIASLGPLHAWTVADALYERVEAARASARSGGAPVVVGTRASSSPPATAPAIATTGIVDVQLAGCHGFFDSPFAAPGDGCPISFTGCLQCRNAVVTADKLPAVITYLHHLLGQRFVMGEDEWCEAWGADFVRIVDDVLPQFDEATLAAAQAQAQEAAGDGFYLPTVATARRYQHG
jgi:hypothetical protein